MSNHAWCHDTARDAAVRAAEDGRTGPLPTLGEAIAGPFVESAERSVTVSKTGEGQSGMRTERVVIEIEHSGPKPINLDDLGLHLRTRLGLFVGLRRINESVRVVEEAVVSVDDRAYADRMACDEERDFANRIIDQRDAAIRERDKAVAKAAEDARAYTAESDARAQAQQELQDRCDTAFFPAESAGSGDAERLHRETWLRLERDELIVKRDELISRVAELEAASGGNPPETPEGSSQAAKPELPTE